MQNSMAFGNAANPVIVGNNSEIVVDGSGAPITAPYNITLSGFGVGGNSGTTSPLLNFAGSNAWAGNITFNTNVTPNMYFVVANATTFTISGVISDATPVGNLSEFGGGTLVFNNANQYRGSTTIDAGTLIVEDPLALGPSSAQQVFVPGSTLELNLIGGTITGVTNSTTPTITTSAPTGFPSASTSISRASPEPPA